MAGGDTPFTLKLALRVALNQTGFDATRLNGVTGLRAFLSVIGARKCYFCVCRTGGWLCFIARTADKDALGYKLWESTPAVFDGKGETDYSNAVVRALIRARLASEIL